MLTSSISMLLIYLHKCLYPDKIYHRNVIYSIIIITSPLQKMRFLIIPFQTLISNLIFDSHNFTNCIYQIEDGGILFWACFVSLCFVLVCINLSKFWKGKYTQKFRSECFTNVVLTSFIIGKSFLSFFSNFITVWRAEGDWLPNIKTQRKFSKAIRADGIFCFTLGRFFMSTTKPNCRSRSKPKTSLNQQDWFNRTFMPLDQTMIKQFMIVKFVNWWCSKEVLGAPIFVRPKGRYHDYCTAIWKKTTAPSKTIPQRLRE